MRTNHKLAVAVLAGIAMGVVGAAAIYAQQVKVPPAYVIAEVEINDPTVFQKYGENVPGTLAAFNGQYLIRGGKILGVEGEAPKRFAVIAFDSMEKAQGWYNSPTYDAIKPIRYSSAKTRLFIAEGVAPK